MIFSRLVADDIVRLREIGESSTSLEQYVSAMRPLVELMSAGPDRAARRAMRVRIVAAAETRKELRVLIGETQARLTDEMVRIVEHGQNRGWLRRDVTARSIAVLVQVVIFGRTLDDVSSEPINQPDWEQAIYALFLNLLTTPKGRGDVDVVN